jgi:hypothetical protein
MKRSRKPHLVKLGLFVLLSLLDLGMTWLLVENSGGRIYESNPIAGWYLARLGWAGLAGFKLAMVLLVGCLVFSIAACRPRAAGHFLSFACLAVGVVLVHSSTLAAQAAAPMDPVFVREEARKSLLERRGALSRAYFRLMRRLVADLVAGRRGLKDATAQLARSERGRTAAWRREVTEAGRTFEESLALRLMCHVASELRDKPEEARKAARRLQAEFDAAFRPASPSQAAAAYAATEGKTF